MPLKAKKVVRKVLTVGLKEEAIVVLRRRVKAQDILINSLKTRVSALENQEDALTRRMVSAETEAEAAISAVRILAYQVSNETAQGKQARSDARKLLEKHKIRPPHSLGSSRKRKARRKKKT